MDDREIKEEKNVNTMHSKIVNNRNLSAESRRLLVRISEEEKN